MNNNLLKTLASGLVHGVKYRLSDKGIFNLDSELGIPSAAYEPMEVVNTCHCGGKIEIELHSCYSNWSVGFVELDEVLPYLRPLSELTEEIEHKGERFVPIEFFEVTDDHTTCPIEQDYGNIKLSKEIESISKNNVGFDVHFLPSWVVEKLIEWHFNVYNLSTDEFIEVTNKNNHYK